MRRSKWIAMGDVNPRDYGGIYARVNRDDKGQIVDVEIVKIDPIGENPKHGYDCQRAEYDRDELKQVWDTHEDPWYFADLGRLDGTFEDNVHWVALAKADYFGIDDTETGNNFWKLLRARGIRPENIS